MDRSSVSWVIILLYFFSWNCTWFGELENSTAHVRFHQIYILIGSLKLVSAFFIKFLFFHQMIGLQNLWKMFFIWSKNLFSFLRYPNFCNFSLPFHTFEIQKGKWKWNNSWCHKLAWINLQMLVLELTQKPLCIT